MLNGLYVCLYILSLSLCVCDKFTRLILRMFVYFEDNSADFCFERENKITTCSLSSLGDANKTIK